MSAASDTRRSLPKTGDPLIDAIAAALLAAYEEGRADAGEDPAEQVTARAVLRRKLADLQALLTLHDMARDAGREPRWVSRSTNTG